MNIKTKANITGIEPVITDTNEKAYIAHVTPLLLSLEEAKELLGIDNLIIEISSLPPPPKPPEGYSKG